MRGELSRNNAAVRVPIARNRILRARSLRIESPPIPGPEAPKQNDPLRALVHMLLAWNLVDDVNITRVRITSNYPAG